MLHKLQENLFKCRSKSLKRQSENNLRLPLVVKKNTTTMNLNKSQDKKFLRSDNSSLKKMSNPLKLLKFKTLIFD